MCLYFIALPRLFCNNICEIVGCVLMVSCGIRSTTQLAFCIQVACLPVCSMLYSCALDVEGPETNEILH